MKLRIACALLLCASAANAQLFKWVDAKGVVHYGDSAPPDRKARELKTGAGAADSPRLPYALAEAARRHPVTLYTTAACAGCDQGRALLRARGIPFAEKTVASAADRQQLRDAGSPGELPLLLVGHARLVGFEPGAWGQALGDAAYPAEAMLPANYRQAQAVAAAPAVAKAPAAAPAQPASSDGAAEGAAEKKRRAPAARSAKPDSPPGFQF